MFIPVLKFKWGTCEAELWHKKLGHFNFRDGANKTDEASQALDLC